MEKGQDASGIILIDDLNRVLLVHQTYGRKVWAIPGGMVENGESAWLAAERELKEEINIVAEGMELAGMYFQPHRNRYIYTFKAYKYIGEIEVDNKEIDEYGFFEIDSLPKPMSSFTAQRLKNAVKSTRTIFKEEIRDTYKILE
jgi:ADP-ribose pyrophosphatase YjhB (NUDIX family)